MLESTLEPPMVRSESRDSPEYQPAVHVGSGDRNKKSFALEGRKTRESDILEEDYDDEE